MTGSEGAIAERYSYSPYGQPTITGRSAKPLNASSIGNTLLFAGRRFDAETGFCYLINRYLIPDLGRFITCDPLGPTADIANLGNSYTYVGNNPINRLDPLGLTWVNCHCGGTKPDAGGSPSAHDEEPSETYEITEKGCDRCELGDGAGGVPSTGALPSPPGGTGGGAVPPDTPPGSDDDKKKQACQFCEDQHWRNRRAAYHLGRTTLFDRTGEGIIMGCAGGLLAAGVGCGVGALIGAFSGLASGALAAWSVRDNALLQADNTYQDCIGQERKVGNNCPDNS
jgi:RHS repeat-associated protein